MHEYPCKIPRLKSTFFNITRSQIKRRDEFEKMLAVTHLFNKNKVYIFHFKYKGLNPWSWLIQRQTKKNGLEPINHTAITYKIYSEPWSPDKSIYVVESILGGARVIDLFHLLKHYKGEIYIEEVEGLLINDERKQEGDEFVKDHCIGKRYSFLRAVASFEFNEMTVFLRKLSNALKWGGAGISGCYCSEAAMRVLHKYAEGSNLKEVNEGYKKLTLKEPDCIYPAEIYGKLGKITRIK